MRLASLLSRFPQDRFVRRAGLLGAATAAGQGGLLLLTPLLTRLYTPRDFGLFAVFATLAALYVAVAFLRLELSLPLCRARELPAACSALVLTGGAVLVLCTLAAWGAVPVLPETVAHFRPMLFLLPFALAAVAAPVPLAPLFVRLGDFRGCALVDGGRLLAQGAGQLLFGLAGAGGTGLVLGYAAGSLGAAAAGWMRLWRAGVCRPARPRPRAARLYLRRHRDHALYLASGSLAHTAAQFLPATLLALLFDLHLAGLYALAQRLLGAPVRLVAGAVSQTLLAELARGGSDPARRVDRLLLLLGGGGAVALTLPLLPGEVGWRWILGPGWSGFPLLLALLAPLFLARFLVEATWNVLVVGRRPLVTAATVGQLGVLLAAYLGTKAAGGPALLAVGLHAAGGTAVAALTLVAIRHTARRLAPKETGRRGGPLPPPAAAGVTTGAGRPPPPSDC